MIFIYGTPKSFKIRMLQSNIAQSCNKNGYAPAFGTYPLRFYCSFLGALPRSPKDSSRYFLRISVGETPITLLKIRLK